MLAGMCSTSSPNVNDEILVEPLKGLVSDVKSPHLFVFQVTEIKPVQLLKTPLPIDDTELGIVTDVKPLQPEKA